jgi:ribonuclease P protein component
MKIKILNKRNLKLQKNFIISIRKKSIKSAVKRNKIKRQIKAIIFEQNIHIKDNKKILFISEITGDLSYSEMLNIFLDFRLKNIILF